MAALLALLSSALWGTADFTGGTLARRLPPTAVAGVGQALALPVVAVVVVAAGAPHNPGGWLGWGAVAGVAEPLALICFYRALATGTMGVVAPVAGTGVLLPVLIGLAQGERPAPVSLAGMALAVVGVVLASGPELRAVEGGSAPGGGRALLLAVAAAVGFGLNLWGLARGSVHSAGMTLLTARTLSVALLAVAAIASRSVGRVRPGDLPALALVGGFDALANGCFVLAAGTTMVATAAVLASQYPVVTVVLARGLHGERLRPLQLLGVGAAVVGVSMVAAR